MWVYKWNGGKPYYTTFSREHFEVVRNQCAELTRSELDLVILGIILIVLSFILGMYAICVNFENANIMWFSSRYLDYNAHA